MRSLLSVFIAVFVSFVDCFAITQKIEDDVIPIPLDCNESESDSIIFRSPAIPIIANVIPSQSIIAVTFLYNIGDVSIEISNLYSNEEYYYEESSLSGTSILPFYGGTGYYYIRFRTLSGLLYSGYFSL